MKRYALITLIIFAFIPLASPSLYANYQTDRQLSEPTNFMDRLQPRLFLLYLGKITSNTCMGFTAETCIKKQGKPDKRQLIGKSEEHLLYYGKKLLYRGTANNNSSVGSEWREYVVVNNHIEDEYEVIQIIEKDTYWLPSLPRLTYCEMYGEKKSVSCDLKRDLKPYGSIPSFPEPLKINKKYSAEEAMGIFLALFSKRLCDQTIQGFSGKSATSYAKWRDENHELIRVIEENPEYEGNVFEEDLEMFLKSVSYKDSDEAEMRCDVLIEHFGTEDSILDPQFASPEKTWNTYIEALREGDRNTAIKCLTSVAKTKFKKIITEMTLKEMEDMANAINAFSLTESYGEFQEAVVSRHDGQAGFITFQKIGSIWKISAM